MPDPKVVEGTQSATTEKVVVQTLPEQEDLQAQVEALEKEKVQLATERDNYRKGMLKAKGKLPDEEIVEEDDEKMRRIAEEAVANSRIAEITREQDALVKKLFKENKELKLAQMNKPGTPSSLGSHAEGQQVQDTSVTPEQLAFFKSRNWSEKDIERYKKNLRRRI